MQGDQNNAPTSQTGMLQSLALSISNQTQFLETVRRERQDEIDKKDKKFDDLHDSSKLLILNASSTNGTDTPLVPVDSCSEFFNKKSVSKAMDFLVVTLSNELGCIVNVESGLTTSLYHGHFLREREDSPGNFSFFLVPKKQPLSTGHFKTAMVLQLKVNAGKGWDDSDLSSALKQGIMTPHDIPNFTHQLKNLWGLVSFFFGRECILAKRLVPFMAKVQKHTLTFEGAHIRDPSFPTKLGYAIDTRIFRWLEECSSCDDRGSVDDSLLNFDVLMNQVMTDSFIQHLPVTFKSVSKQTDDDPIQPQKKLKIEEKQQRVEKQRLINNKPINDWVVPHEVYKRDFAGKNLHLRPKLNGKDMCQRYHSKGYCFDDCPLRVTHIPSEQLETKVKEAYKKFVHQCKQK